VFEGSSSTLMKLFVAAFAPVVCVAFGGSRSDPCGAIEDAVVRLDAYTTAGDVSEIPAKVALYAPNFQWFEEGVLNENASSGSTDPAIQELAYQMSDWGPFEYKGFECESRPDGSTTFSLMSRFETVYSPALDDTFVGNWLTLKGTSNADGLFESFDFTNPRISEFWAWWGAAWAAEFPPQN